jgi:hypothetical protein
MTRIRASIKRAIMRELEIPSDGRPKRRRPFAKGGHMSSDATADDLPPLPAWMVKPDGQPEEAT